MPRATRVLVIGLDCAPPALVFDRLATRMPALSGLVARGVHGPMRSSIPPITVPAWACMTTGRDPGELGIYGFRSRVPRSYAQRIVSSADVAVPRVWDLAARAGRRALALFVPPSWPPPEGACEIVSCLLTPGAEAPWTHPPTLARELSARFGPYVPDVEDYRNVPTAALLDRLEAATRQRFAMARHLWQTRRPDLLMMVDVALDRLHHACWSLLDPGDPRHDPAAPLRARAEGYYALLDEEIGAFVALADEDTAILVVSDHGARSLEGAIHVNGWLRDAGWLRLRDGGPTEGPLEPDAIDWSRTRAWGEGGYHARVFLNVRGREPAGIVPPEEVGTTLDALRRALTEMRHPDGRALGNRVLTPAEAYREVRGAPPDLLVFFGDLRYRALGSLPRGGWFSEHNDTGHDEANHDWDGVFVAAGAGVPRGGRLAGLSLFDVTPTVLGLLGIAPPEGGLGADRSLG